MNCSQVTDQLPAFLDGDLPPGEAAQLEDHLKACPACRREQAALRQVQRLLDAVPTPRVEVDLSRLYQQAAALQQRRLRRWRRGAYAGFGLAAAVLLLAVGLRLEVRLEGHQAVLRWGTPPVAAPTPAPTVPEPPVQLVAISDAQLRVVRELIHALAKDVNARALAEDVQARDEWQRQRIAHLQDQLNRLQWQTDRRLTAAEQDVSALYRYEFVLSKKGATP
jgi:anti-sigma factor RsiW